MILSNLVKCALGFASCVVIACAQENRINVLSNSSLSRFNDGSADGLKIVDSLRINRLKCDKKNNECDIVILSGNKIMYSVKDRDGNIEIEYNSSIAKSNKHYVFMNVNDLAVGITWNIVIVKETEQVFVTDKYDVHAVGDYIVPHTVSESNRNIMVKSGEDSSKTYFVRLNLFSKT